MTSGNINSQLTDQIDEIHLELEEAMQNYLILRTGKNECRTISLLQKILKLLLQNLRSWLINGVRTFGKGSKADNWTRLADPELTIKMSLDDDILEANKAEENKLQDL